MVPKYDGKLSSRIVTASFSMFDWLTRRFRRPTSAGPAQAHLTFGATSVGRTIMRTGVLLRKQLWIWPIIAVIVLAAIGLGIRVAIERTMRHNLTSQLQSTLALEGSMLEAWLRVQEHNA